jgi:hypothetical protein
MLTDFTASGAVNSQNAAAYQESITMTLSNSDLTGSAIIEEDQDLDNNYWVVLSMEKADAAREIKRAEEAAGFAVPQGAARLEAALEKYASGPAVFSGR